MSILEALLLSNVTRTYFIRKRTKKTEDASVHTFQKTDNNIVGLLFHIKM